MPGWEIIDNKEKKAIDSLFKFKKKELKNLYSKVVKKFLNLKRNLQTLLDLSIQYVYQVELQP